MGERIELRNRNWLWGLADFFALWKNKMVDFCKKGTQVRKTFKSLAFKQ